MSDYLDDMPKDAQRLYCGQWVKIVRGKVFAWRSDEWRLSSHKAKDILESREQPYRVGGRGRVNP